jgi:PhnB protein
MAKINAYLTFENQTEVAFNFYKSVFGGEFVDGIHKFRDMPDNEKLSETDKEKVMHVTLKFGENVLMASDMLDTPDCPKPIIGNNISLSINTDSKDEADKLFSGLSDGGTVTMPIADTFWGAYFGMFTDKFGINWMINFDYPKE